MKTIKLGLAVVWAVFLMSAGVSGQEMVFQYSFPTEAMLAQDVYLNYGAGLALDRSGSVWVVDSGDGVVKQFDPAGRFLKKVGRPGQGPGEFSRPMTIHVMEDGDLLILDFGNQRMAVLSSEGEFIRSFPLRRRYEDFCEIKGKIYLVYNSLREDGKTVDVLSLDGEPLGSLGEAPDFGPVIPDLVRMANYKVISAAPDGRLLVGWNFFPIVHVLDVRQKEEVVKIEIDHPELRKRYRNNLGELNVQKDTPRIYWVVQRTRAHRGGFLASMPAERIEFLDCDLKGKVRATYWAPAPEEEVVKIEIDHPELRKRYRNNLGELNVQKDTPRIYWVVQRTRAHRGGFLASMPAERIEFLDCDLKGKVRATYWAPAPEEDYLGRDFICREDGSTTWIYVLQTRPDSKVNVYRIEAKRPLARPETSPGRS